MKICEPLETLIKMLITWLIKLTKPFLFYLGSKFTFYNKNSNRDLHINKCRLEGVVNTFTFFYIDVIMHKYFFFYYENKRTNQKLV